MHELSQPTAFGQRRKVADALSCITNIELLFSVFSRGSTGTELSSTKRTTSRTYILVVRPLAAPCSRTLGGVSLARRSTRTFKTSTRLSSTFVREYNLNSMSCLASFAFPGSKRKASWNSTRTRTYVSLYWCFMRQAVVRYQRCRIFQNKTESKFE